MDSNIIKILEENEIQFCKNWSRRIIKFEHKFITFYNKDLADDYFFNRTILNENLILPLKNCDEGKNTIHSLFHFLNDLKIPLFLHLKPNQNILNQNILDKLKKIDDIFGLLYYNMDNSKNIKKLDISRKSCTATKIEIVTDCFKLVDWVDTYCLSFGIGPGKKNLIYGILKEKINDFIFILSGLDDLGDHGYVYTGCCILFTYKSSIALYCLGTKKEYRNQNIASDIIEYSIKFGESIGCNIFGLQTLKSDSLLSFYIKRGFVKVYESLIFKYSDS
ncbi:MAG TPA: GNAT family N-acetyltransferase [Verrucomicrobiae bacterium]|nr:GNAT family N-acetyltransferase [Verrucomicrobiae bacterium]